MNGNRARSAPSWRVSDARPFRPQLVLAAIAVMGVLLMEVWQCSTVASLSEQVGRADAPAAAGQRRAGVDARRSSSAPRAARRSARWRARSACGPPIRSASCCCPRSTSSRPRRAASASRAPLLALAGRAVHCARAGRRGTWSSRELIQSFPIGATGDDVPAAPQHRARGSAVSVNRRFQGGNSWPTGTCARVGCCWPRPASSSLLVGLWVRVAWLQVGAARRTSSPAPRRTSSQRHKLVPRRGELLDCNGRVLAHDLPVSRIAVIRAQLTDPAARGTRVWRRCWA